MKIIGKKSTSILLIFAILFAFSSYFPTVKVSAATSGQCGANLTWTLDDSGTLTISGTGDMYAWNSYNPASWQNNSDNITKVIIESGATSIGYRAFYWCKFITQVTIPNTITIIKSSAFDGCESLISVIIPEGVEKIEGSAFSGCKSLQSISLPESLTYLGPDFIYSCESLINLHIPANVTGDWWADISWCNSLTQITVDEDNQFFCDVNGVLFNKEKTTLFAYPASKLGAYYAIPDSVEKIESHAFNSCQFLKEVTIPSKVSELVGSFAYCYSLENIILPSSITSVGDGAFRECALLESIILSSNVTYIGDRAFDSCKSLQEILIPSGVVSIGDSAFCGCDVLESVIIPDTVQTIGSSAFSSCYALKEINIPDSVTSIGKSAFSNCHLLNDIKLPNNIHTISNWMISFCYDINNIIIPKSVTSIEEYAFIWCESLESVTIPENVTIISNYTFYKCKSLKNIIISSNLTSIEESAFSWCESLENMIIPEKVTSIGANTFAWCDALESVTIPESVTSIGVDAFYGCPLLTIYGYTGSYAEQYANENGIPFVSIGQATVAVQGIYTIKVVNLNADPIQGATVSFGENSVQTNERGLAEFPLSQVTGNLKITAAGYPDYELHNYTRTSVNWDFILMVGEGVRSVQMNYNGKETDLLSKKETIDRKYFNTPFTLTIKTEEPENTPREYGIMKLDMATGNSSQVITPQSSNVLHVTVQNFEQGAKYYAYVKYPETGIYHSAQIQLEVTDSRTVPEWELELGGGGALSFSNVSELGGLFSGISVDSPYIQSPLSIKIVEDKYYVGVNLFSRDPLTGERTDIFQFDGRQFEQAYQKAVRELNQSKWRSGVSVAVYMEGKIRDGHQTRLDGRIVYKQSMGWGKNFQIYPFGIPFVIGVDMSMSVEADGRFTNITILPPSAESIELLATVTGGLEVSAGPGFPAANVQVYANGEISATSALISDYPGFREASAALSGGIKAQLLWGEWHVEMGKTVFPLYSVDVPSSPGPGSNALSGMFDLANYVTCNRDYLRERSAWLDTVNDPTVPGDGDSALPAINVLQQNTYKGIRPQIVTCGDTAMMVYTDADTSRTLENQTVAVYSLYNSATGTWSQPQKIHEDGTADYMPQVYSDGQNIWAAWQDAPAAISSGAELSQINSFELCTAQFDFEQGCFVQPANVTSNAVYESNQKFVTANGTTYLVWATSTENDVFDLDNLFYSSYTNSTWSAPAAVASQINGSIVSMDTGILGSDICIACAVDTDGDLNTSEDVEIYCYTLSGQATRITNDAIADSAPAFASFNNENILYWNSGSGLSTISALTDTPEALLGENIVLPNNARLVTGDGKASVLYIRENNLKSIAWDSVSGAWGSEVTLTQQDKYIRNPAAFYQNGGLITVFNQIDATITDEALTEVYTLCSLKRDPVCDITLENIYLDLNEVIPGESAQLSFSVKNSGDIQTDAFVVTLKDSHNSIISQETIETGILSGCTEDFITQFTVPSTSADSIQVTVAPSGNTDANTADNAAALSLDYADLEVNMEKTVIGGIETVVAEVKNNGNIAAGGELNIENEQGEIVYSAVIPPIDSNNSVVYTIDIDSTYFDENTSWDVLTAYVETTAEELYDYNNIAKVMIDKHQNYAGTYAISENTAEIAVGEEKALSVSGPVENIEWTSANTSVASVSEAGIVTGASAGTAVITATVDGWMAFTCTVTVTAADTELEILRIAGTSRYDTAVAISQEGWESAQTVVLANGLNYADALAGVPLASAFDAPILLTAGGDTLEASVAARIQALGAQKVIILGGQLAVSQAIQTALSADYTVERISGSNRFATSAQVALRVAGDNKPDTAILVTGMGYADALSISPYAGLKGYPIVYANPETGIGTEVMSYLEGVDNVIVVGGELAVTPAAVAQLCDRNVTRISGTSRYLTSYEIANRFKSEFANNIMLATGTNFPDALAGSVLAAKRQYPLLLVDQPAIISQTQQFILEKNPQKIYILGGESVLPTSLVESMYQES